MTSTSDDRPWLLVVDPQRIFADPASDWASSFFPAAMTQIRRLATHVGPERTLVTRWLPTADRSTAWGDYFRAWPFADVQIGRASCRDRVDIGEGSVVKMKRSGELEM